MSKEQLGPDPSDRAMRVRSKPVKYIASDEEESEIELTSESDEEFDIPMPKKAVAKTSSKPAAKPAKVNSKCVRVRLWTGYQAHTGFHKGLS